MDPFGSPVKVGFLGLDDGGERFYFLVLLVEFLLAALGKFSNLEAASRLFELLALVFFPLEPVHFGLKHSLLESFN